MSDNPIFFSPLVDTAEHHRELRESVARLVGKFGRKYFQQVVADGVQPVALWKELGEAGFLGVHISENYGGGGGGLAELNIVIEETAAQGCPMLALVIASICAPIIEKFGSEELKNKWLPGLATGRRRMAFAITEPDAGSNTHRVTTTSKSDGDGYVLNGSKYWTSAIDESEAVLVVARDGDIAVEPGRSALSLFIVPTDAPGLSWQPIDAALRSPERQFTVFFDNVGSRRTR
jgi:alkylation response protein AidB-like acyl-CoA dehydrogenase